MFMIMMSVAGYFCEDWQGISCDSYEGYTQDDMQAVRDNCPMTCGLCDDMPAPVPSAAQWALVFSWLAEGAQKVCRACNYHACCPSFPCLHKPPAY